MTNPKSSPKSSWTSAGYSAAAPQGFLSLTLSASVQKMMVTMTIDKWWVVAVVVDLVEVVVVVMTVVLLVTTGDSLVLVQVMVLVVVVVMVGRVGRATLLILDHLF